MHRNTFLLTIFLAVFAVLVLVVNIIQTGKNSSDVPAASPSPIPSGRQTVYIPYTNDACGIRFEYPDSFRLLDNDAGSVVLVSTGDDPDSIIVTCQEAVPMPALDTERIEKYPVGTISGILFHDVSEKDGSDIDKLIFHNPQLQKDIYVSGFGNAFDSLISSIKLSGSSEEQKASPSAEMPEDYSE